MTASILTIGDEILIGQIVNTNSVFIAKALDKIGIEITEMLSISDNQKVITDTLNRLQNKVDFVIITGGLGPTKDDVTKKTFCNYFNDKLIINKDVLKHVTFIIEDFYKRKITQINKDQALVPSKCTVLHNKVGTAPGMWMQKQNTVFVSLPGVPFEMKYLIENEVVPKIINDFKQSYIIHKTIRTYGQGESLVAERLENWENSLPTSVKLAYLPSAGSVRLRLSGKSNDKEELEKIIEKEVKTLCKLIPDIIVGFEDSESIEAILGKLLTQNQKTLATAESCTGGKIAQTITSVPGSSAYFKGGVVTYATESKTTILNIPKTFIEKHSVASLEVAKAMATAVQKKMNTNYALATTGNAGPSAGDKNVNIGVVFIALATPNEVIAQEFNFGQPREKVIDGAVIKSLEMLRKEILKNIK